MTVAILTGDIVKSTKLSQTERETLFSALKTTADVVADWQGTSTLFTRFSGDGWQCMLTNPALALRVCLLFRSHIRQLSKTFDTRIFVGIGAVENLSDDGLGASDGRALRLSGRGLTGLRPAQYFGASENNAVFVLADEISRHWTQKQAEVFTLGLQPNAPSQEAIAEKLGVSQQAIAKRLRAGGEAALLSACVEMEQINNS
ncbi:MAG: hypothetical protein JKY31_02335 [Rhodobacteraceae bacterium]|nr:hypothetical protein [Paracoccaceae bacterium]